MQNSVAKLNSLQIKLKRDTNLSKDSAVLEVFLDTKLILMKSWITTLRTLVETTSILMKISSDTDDSSLLITNL
jgi:hypothetical protein